MDEMNEIVARPRKLAEVLTLDTTLEEFESVVESLITQEDKQTFGEDAFDKVLAGFLYSSVFAPEPAELTRSNSGQ